MAVYFVDSTTGDDGDSGLTMDLAWATLDYALTAGSLVAGDFVFIRRLHSESPTSIPTVTYDGTAEDPITVMGWPRAADASITSATWTEGSTTVDNIVGLSMDREKHLGRWISSPNGSDYVITKIDDSDTITVDTPYAGNTVTGTNGACTIHADDEWYDDMGAAYGFDDAAWTIKETAWDADADDLPKLDFTGGSYYLYLNSAAFWRISNMDFAADGLYTIRWSGPKSSLMRGCIFANSANQTILYFQTGHFELDRVIGVGSGSGGTQTGTVIQYARVHCRNSAFYGFGDTAWQQSYSNSYLENVNLGVEEANGDADLVSQVQGNVVGRDVMFGGAVEEVETEYGHYGYSTVTIENHNKVLGAHKTWNGHGNVTKTDVVGGSGNPEKRSGGSDSIIALQYNLSGTVNSMRAAFKEVVTPVFTHEFEVNNESKTYRYYVQAEGIVAADEIWIEAEYVSKYTGAAKYVISKVESDENIPARANASDWSRYLEVAVQPAVHSGLSKVRIKLFCRYYHLTNKIYIDPNPEIT